MFSSLRVASVFLVLHMLASGTKRKLAASFLCKESRAPMWSLRLDMCPGS